jgi:hypothetical protein
MGRGGVDRPPYWTGFHLSGWAVGNYDLLRAKITQSGQRIEDLSARQILDWSAAIIFDSIAAALPSKSIESIVWKCRDIWSQPPWPDRDYWGTSQEAQRGAAAMADLAGGPAPPREG